MTRLYIFIGLLLITVNVFGSAVTRQTNYRVPLTADSIEVFWVIDGALADSSKRTGGLLSFDTTWSIGDQEHWYIYFRTWGAVYGPDAGYGLGEYWFDNTVKGDTSGGDLSVLQDSINIILDSLEALESWVATTAKQTLIIDTVNGIIDTLQLQDDWVAHQTTIDSVMDSVGASVLASIVVSDTNVNGDTLATQGKDQNFRLKTFIVANQTGDAVTFTAGVGGGDPIAGDALVLTSAYNGDGLVATGNGTGVDIRGDITGDLTGDVTGSVASVTTVNGIANGVITTPTFAAGAITSTVLATDAITSDEIATSAANEISLDVWSETVRLLSSNVMILAAGQATKIRDSVWLETGTRALTELDEDNTTMDLNATAIGAAASVTADVNIADVDMGIMADSFWNLAFATAFTAGSMGDSLNNSSYVQGSVAGLTAAQIMDSLFGRLVSDTATGTFMAELFHNAQIGGDSSSWASLTDVWRNQDTTHVDSSAIGAWIENNSGAAAASNWSDIQRDSMLSIAEDAGKLGLMLDSIFAIIDTLQNQDNWIATVANQTTINTAVQKIDDSLELYDTRFDSLLAALADASIGDKVWSDYATRLTSDGNWTNSQIDSILNAVDDANKSNFMADVSSLSTFDNTSDSVIVDVSSARTTGVGGGLIGQIEDSIHANAADYKATGYSTHNPAGVYSEFTSGSNEDAFKATGFATPTDSMLLANRGEIADQFEDSVHANTADYKADVSSLSTFDETTDSVFVDISSALTAGLADSVADVVWNEDSTGHYTSPNMAFISAQTAAAGFTAADIADAVWDEDSTGHYTPGQMAYEASQTTATALTEAGIADAVWNEDTTGHYVVGKYGYEAVQSGGGSDTTAIRTMMDNENFARNTDSLLLANRAEVSSQVADSVKNDSLVYQGEGSDTTSIRTMMDAENFARNTDSMLLANRAEISGQIEDSVHANAGDYKATGYSSHSAADVWGIADRQLTTFDEDNTTIDINNTTLGYVNVVVLPVLISSSAANQIADSVKNDSAAYAATNVSSHSALDVYNTFIAGTNEDVFKADSTYLKDGEATKISDTVGSITASVDKDSVAHAVWGALQSDYDSTGKFGSLLDVAVSSIAGLAGNGAYTYQITALDTGATVDSVLTNGLIFVNNQAQNLSGGPYQAQLNNNGIASFQLDAGTWVMFTTEPGFAQKLDTFTVSAAVSDTLMVYRDAGAKTTVAWQLDKPNGAAYASAKVSINLVHQYLDDSILYVSDTTFPAAPRKEIEATVNANGLLSINLWPNASISGDSSWYQITAKDSRNRPIQRSFNVRIPVADTTVWIQNLTRWK